MWIIYFHEIKSKDYNKVSRIFSESNIQVNHYSHMLITKCLLEHFCMKKSWRNIANKYGINYITLYQIHKKILQTQVIHSLFRYLIEREILVYFSKDEKSIVRSQGDTAKTLRALDSFGFKETI